MTTRVIDPALQQTSVVPQGGDSYFPSIPNEFELADQVLLETKDT